MHLDPLIPTLVGLVLSILLLGFLLNLSQIGEFSFILAATGRQAEIITEYAYQTTLAVISISLILSAPWIALVRRLLEPAASPTERAP